MVIKLKTKQYDYRVYKLGLISYKIECIKLFIKILMLCLLLNYNHKQ